MAVECEHSRLKSINLLNRGQCNWFWIVVVTLILVYPFDDDIPCIVDIRG